MSSLATLTAPEPVAQDAAIQVKRALAHSFFQIENTLTAVRQLCDQHGRVEINAALGSEAGEVAMIYTALKTFVEQTKPGTKIPDLPS